MHALNLHVAVSNNMDHSTITEFMTYDNPRNCDKLTNQKFIRTKTDMTNIYNTMLPTKGESFDALDFRHIL